ncbi:MAG: thermonuclease family protein [Bacteroidota bacterium]
MKKSINQFIYHYNAKVVSVYDGDTITVDIDLGLSVFIKGEKLRLLRINAPELRGKSKSKGIKSRDFLKKIVDGKEIVIETIKDRREKYGRYLAEVWIKDGNEFVNVNDLMVEKGFAVYKKY